MPKNEYDVAIIGAGIIGCSIAWELLNRGVNVVLIDSHDKPFQGSSNAGFGSLTPYSDPFFVGEAQDFAAESVDLYRNEWIPKLSEQLGIQIPVSDNGLIELFIDEVHFKKGKEHAKSLNEKREGIAQVLSVEETKKLEPSLTSNFVGALWLDEPWVDKEMYFNALEKFLRPLLATNFMLNTKVKEVLKENNIFVIKSNDDVEIRSFKIIVCTGLNTSEIGGLPKIPKLKWIRGDAIGVYTKDNEPLLKRHIYMGNGFITPRNNGYMLLGATYETDIDVPSQKNLMHRDRISLNMFKSLIECNERIIPALADCEVCRVWRGWRPTPPDKMPLLGTLKDFPDIVIANGFIGLGITMAPGVARVIGNYLIDEKDEFPKTFDPNRIFIEEAEERQ